MIGAGDEGTDRLIQLRQRQSRCASRLALDEVAGQLGQEFGVEGPEQALDLAPALRARDAGIHDPDVQARSYLVEVLAGEVAAVIDVEHVRNAADRPSRVRLAPDRVTQREARIERRGRTQEHQGSRIRVCGPMLGVISETSGSPDALTKPTEYEASKRPQRRLGPVF